MEVSMHVLWSWREGFLTFQLLLQNARYLAYVMIVPVSHALKLMKFSVLIQKPYAQETTSAQKSMGKDWYVIFPLSLLSPHNGAIGKWPENDKLRLQKAFLFFWTQSRELQSCKP